MSKLEFSRPFSLEHAKAGAPYCCRDGEEAIVLKWDGRRFNEPLVGCIGADDIPASWGGDGRYVPDEHGPRQRDLVMLPVGMCQSKPVFMGDELVTRFGDKFVVEAKHISDLDEENTWPPSYPVTQMRLEDFDAAIIASGSKECISASVAYSIANAALRHSLDAGQMVPSDVSAELVRKSYADGQAIAYQHEAGGRAARDLAIALAVQNSCMSRCEPIAGRAQLMRALGDIDLNAIIAGFGDAKDAKEGAK